MRHADVTDEYLLSGVKRTSGAQYSESADALYQSDYPTLISPKRLRNSNFVIETGAGRGQPRPTFMWFPISTAPFDRDLELGIVDSSGVRAFSFPCRRIVGGWVKAETKMPVAVCPTHWRDWSTDGSAAHSPFKPQTARYEFV